MSIWWQCSVCLYNSMPVSNATQSHSFYFLSVLFLYHATNYFPFRLMILFLQAVILEVSAYYYTSMEFLQLSMVHYVCFNIGSTILYFLQRKRFLKPSLRVRCYKMDTISFTCQLLTKLGNDRQTQKSKQAFAHPSVRINEQFFLNRK
jgi:hypothetical protein